MPPNTTLLAESEPQDKRISHIEGVAAEDLILSSPESRKTFDDFMWNYAGDPYLDKFPEIRRQHPLAGDCDYGNRIMSYCYSSQGSLVHIRRTWDKKPCTEAEYFIVTADLAAGGSSVEWEVLEVVYTRSDYGMSINMILRNGANTALLALSNKGFTLYNGKLSAPEILMPGSELSTKLGLKSAVIY